MSVATFASLEGGQPCSYLAWGVCVGRGGVITWGPPPDPGIDCRSGSPPGPAVFCLKRSSAPRLPPRSTLASLLQLEGADAVAMSGLVTRVDPVRERLDQAHQRRVGADIRRAVGGVVENQLRVLRDVGEGRVRDRDGASATMPGEFQRPEDE